VSLSKPKAALTPIPEQAQFETQIDDVAGTKVERVKQPDGTYTIVRSALPLSAEDQALQDTFKQIQQSSLDYITKLSNNYNVDDIPWLKQYLTDYQATQSKAITDNAVATGNAEEKLLARYGQADSTAGAQARIARAGTVMDQKAQLARDMSGIEQDARSQELNRQGSLYSLASGALNGQQGTQLNSLAGLVNSGLSQQQNQQNYNNSVAATIGANNAAKAAASQAGFNNLATIAGIAAAPFTGGASLALTGGGLFSMASGGSAAAKAGTSGGWANYGSGLGNQVYWNTGRMA
jgi:hypothetical protein